MEVSGHLYAPAALCREGTPVRTGQQAVWAPEQVWTASGKGKSLYLPGIRAPYV